jgi:hypothetical protein
MEGPYRYRGTLRGEPVSGFAFYERSLALHRDWELVDVLAAVVDGLDSMVATVRDLITDGRDHEAVDYLNNGLRPECPEAAGIIDDLVTALSSK